VTRPKRPVVSSTAADNVPDDSPIEVIRRDIACPACGYNLRGLQGETVTCPECGLACDAAKLVTRQWDRPWHQAPGFALTLVPGCWLYVSVLMSPVVLALTNSPAVACAALVGFGGLGSLALFWFVRRWWGSNEGLFLALLPPILIVGYLAALAGIVGGIARILIPGHVLEAMFGVGIAAASLALGWACRRGERFIASRCIRHYLAAAAVADARRPSVQASGSPG
jgi:hypothetical protein